MRKVKNCTYNYLNHLTLLNLTYTDSICFYVSIWSISNKFAILVRNASVDAGDWFSIRFYFWYDCMVSVIVSSRSATGHYRLASRDGRALPHCLPWLWLSILIHSSTFARELCNLFNGVSSAVNLNWLQSYTCYRSWLEHPGAVLLTGGRSYVGNDVIHSTFLDRACACSYENLPKYLPQPALGTRPPETV